ncbi:MAG: penicillin acylase family protein [Chitinophagaceae bacterium]|nr:penicillin acylase family protein [Chitinophagaceae bacterium]
MMKSCILIILSVIPYAFCKAQIDVRNIVIARDSFGIPHIFAPTDPEVAYGLAWAHAEDDFETLQWVILSGKAKLSTALGKTGGQADYLIQLLQCRRQVEKLWPTLSEDFLALIKGYVQGLNDYARKNPGLVKYKKAFPFDEKDYMTATLFSVTLFCGVEDALRKIYSGGVKTLPGFVAGGSNAIAMNSQKTISGESFLVLNAHQPNTGPFAFYEAHLCSQQGWNPLGGLFPGACVILHGTNEHLGWAHTINYQDKVDIYQLQMHPYRPNLYKWDEKWIPLEIKKARLKIKGLPFTIRKKVYESVYGPTVKTKKGVFSIRTAALSDIRALEQWYRMNKAVNFSTFYQAIAPIHIPMFNIIYADRYDTIFYISNGKIPERPHHPDRNWKETVQGNTSATLWTTLKKIHQLPQYVNPPSGYLYNTNHSPFLATARPYQLDSNLFDKNDGWETHHNNRSLRLTELIGEEKINYEQFKKIKFDITLPSVLQYPYQIDSMLNLPAKDYPALENIIQTFQQWDKSASVDSKGAAIFVIAYYYLAEKLRGAPPGKLSKAQAVETFQFVYDYMMKYFGTTGITLGDLQKLVRGTKELPMHGFPDVLSPSFSEPYKKGLRKVTGGDAYICFVRYPKDGSLPQIESVNTFGASMNPASPHFADQMPLFLKQQTKRLSMDKEEVLKTAIRIYHPF